MAKAIAERRHNLRRLVHNYGQLTAELADKDHEIANLVDASNAVFHAFAAENQNVSYAVARLPGTLNTTGADAAEGEHAVRRAAPEPRLAAAGVQAAQQGEQSGAARS